MATANPVSNHSYTIDDGFSFFVPNFGGTHNFKVGGTYGYQGLHNYSQSNMNGTFSFSTSDAPFNPADPRTYPDRLSIRVPVQQKTYSRESYFAGYIQDKWQPVRRLTLDLGLRYDVEYVTVAELNNPKFQNPGDYPVDRNNFAPRTGFAYALSNRTVFRGGWGLFFQRTQFGNTSRYFTSGPYADSFTVSFPANNIDSGPSRGQLPTDPMLSWVQANGLTINRAYLNSLYPAGATQKNAGAVSLDDPDRHRPYSSHILSWIPTTAWNQHGDNGGLYRQPDQGYAHSERFESRFARRYFSNGNRQPKRSELCNNGEFANECRLAELPCVAVAVRKTFKQPLLVPVVLYVGERVGKCCG